MKGPLTANEVNYFKEQEVIQTERIKFNIANEVNHLQNQAN